jgi:hypothetical protein
MSSMQTANSIHRKTKTKPKLKLSTATLLVYGAFCLVVLTVAILTLRY